MPRGDRDWMKLFEFPLPPLTEQKKIVAQLDRAKARAEKLRAAAERGAAACAVWRRAVLREAFA